MELGKMLMVIGAVILIIGLLLTFSDRLPFYLGRLPGDIIYKKEGFSFYFPITTSILVSVVLSLLFYLFGKIFR